MGISDGAIHREVARGSLVRRHPRVFVDPAVPKCWEQELCAALLWAGDAAAVSHRAAAALWNLDGFQRQLTEITMPSPRHGRPDVISHRGLFLPGDTSHVKGMRVTSPSRTLMDVASVADPEGLELALDCALRRGLTSVDYLQRRLQARETRGRKRIKILRRLLAERQDGAGSSESALETRFLRLVRKHRLPVPQAGFEVGPYRIDFAYPDLRLGIELDGYVFHSGRQVWQRDLGRQNYLLSLGWMLLRFTWEDVTRRGAEVVAALRSHIAPTLLH